MAELHSYLDRLEESPDDAQALSAVEEIYAEQRLFSELIALYESLAGRLEPTMGAQLWQRGATLYIEQLQQNAKAEPLLKQALNADPGLLAASVVLRDLYLKRGAVTEAVEQYERELRSQNESPQVSDGWVEVANLCLDRLHDHGRALNALEEAVSTDGLNPEPYKLRGRIHAERGRPRLVFDALMNELRVGGLDESRMARLQELAQEMVKKPRLHALATRAVEKLEELSEDNPVAVTVQHELERCRKDWKQKVLELDGRAMHVSISDEQEAARLWLQVAELQLAYGEHRDAALVSLDKALGASPGDEEGLTLLRDVYEENGRYDALAQELEKMASTVKSERQATELSFQAAQLYEEELANSAGAARVYRQILEREPTNERAIDRLANYYFENEQPEESIRVLEKLAQNDSVDLTTRIAAHVRIAGVCTHELEDTTQALEQWEHVLALNPSHEKAAAALEETYRQEGQEEGLARFLELRLGSVVPHERMAMMEELGGLYADKLSAPDRALIHFGDLYEAAASEEFREKLERLADTPERAEEIAGYLTRGVDGIFDAELKELEAAGLAHFLEFEVGQFEKALQVHRGRLASNPPETTETCDSIARLLMRLAPETDVVPFFQREVERAVTPEERIETLLLLAGALVEAQLEGDAADTWRRILDIDATQNDAFQKLSNFLQESSAFEELVQRHTSRIGKLDLDQDMGHACCELGGILATSDATQEEAAGWYIQALEKLGHHEESVAALERLFSHDVAPSEIAKTLEPLYADANNYAGEARMLEVLADRENVDFAAADMFRRLLEIYDSKMNRPSDAHRCALRAFAHDGQDDMLANNILRLSSSEDQCEAARDAFVHMIPKLNAEPKQRMALRAALAGKSLADESQSLSHALMAFGTREATNAAAGELLRELVTDFAKSESLFELASDQAESTTEDGRRAMWCELAQSFEQPWQNIPRAIDSWEHVRAIPESPPNCLPALDRLYHELGDAQRQGSYLQSRLDETLGVDERVAYGRKLMDLLGGELNELEGAILCGEELVDFCSHERWLWEKLAPLYLATVNREGLLEACSTELPLIDDDKERRLRALDYARGFGLTLGDVFEAERILRRVFAESPGHSGARAVCKELYDRHDAAKVRRVIGGIWIDETENAKDYDGLVRFCESHEAGLENEVTAVPLLSRMAVWYEQSLGDAPSALDCLTRAFSLRPSDSRLGESWFALAEKVGDWQTVLTAYELQTQQDGEPTTVECRERRAFVMARKLNDVPSAITELLKLGKDDLPQSETTLRQLCEYARETNQHELLANALFALHPLVKSQPARPKLELLYELAHVCEEQLGDDDRARAALEIAQRLDSRPLEALRWQERLLEGTEKSSELLRVLTDLVDPLIANPNLRDDLIKKGKLHHRLGEYPEALDCYERVLELQRDDGSAIVGLEALVEQGQCVEPAAKILDPIYTVGEAHQKLVWLLGHRLEGLQDPHERKHLLRRLGELVDSKLGNVSGAFDFACQALSLEPGDAGLRMWLAELAERSDNGEALAEFYGRLATELEDPTNVQYHRRAAVLYHHELNNYPAAVIEYRAILELSPRDEKALSGLEHIYRETSDFAPWIEVLRMRIDGEPGRNKVVAYLRQIASHYLDGLGDREAAAKTLRELFDLAPGTPGVFDGLEQLYGELENHEGLLELYTNERSRLLGEESDDAMADWLDFTTRQARLHYEGFQDGESAMALLAEVFEDRPDYEAADSWVRGVATDGDPAVLDFLDERYARRQAFPDLAELLELKLSHAIESNLRSALLVRIADVRNNELGQPKQALGALALALRECPQNTELLDRMWEIGGSCALWREVSNLIKKSLESAEDPLRFSWYEKLGACARDELADVEEAIVCYDVCRKIEPDNIGILKALDALYGAAQLWGVQIDTKEQILGLTTPSIERCDLLVSLAQLYDERVDKPEAARRACARLLEEDPGHLQGLELEESLFRKAELWLPLERNLRMQQAVRTDLRQLSRLHRDLARLYDANLDSPPRAIESWRDLLTLEPNDKEALEELDRLLGESKRFPELLDHLLVILEQGEDWANRRDLFLRRGRILRDELATPQGAESDWNEVLKIEPNHVEALDSLAALLMEAQRFDAWTQVLEQRLALPDANYVERKLRLIQVLSQELREPLRAREHAESLLSHEPVDDQALGRLAELSLSMGEAELAVSVLKRLANQATEPPVEREALYKITQIYEDVLNAAGGALFAWERLWGSSETDFQPYEALEQLYTQSAQWPSLVALHEEAVARLDSLDTVAPLQKILEVQQEHLQMPERAFMTAGRLYRVKPDDAGAAQTLVKLGQSLGCVDEAVAIFEDQLDEIRDSRVRVARLMDLGALYHSTLKDLDSAENAFERALQIAPEHVPALDGLLRVAVDDERFDKQLAVLERKQAIARSAQEKKALLVAMGRIWEDEIGDAGRAIGIYQRVLELLPNDHDALLALRRLYGLSGDHEALRDVLVRLVDQTTEMEPSIELRFTLAKLLAGPLGNVSEAIRWLDSILILSPEHREVWAFLEELLLRAENNDGLRDLFLHQLSSLSLPAERIPVLRKLSSLYKLGFGLTQEACDCLEEVLQLEPTNREVVVELGEYLTELEDWPRAIIMMGHHLKLLSHPDEKADIYRAMGEVYHTHLGRVDLAEQAYNQVRVLQPESPEALHALGQLYERSGNWFQALDMIEQEAQLTPENLLKARLFERMGRIQEGMLLNPEGAASAYTQALELDPAAILAIESLKSMAAANEDWGTYIRYLKQEIEVSEDEEDRFDLHVEAGKYYDTHAEDDLRAIEHFEMAVEIDAAHVESNGQLAELHFRNENYVDAGQYYKRILNLTQGAATPEETCHRKYRLGYTCERLGQLDQALGAYEEAVAANTGNLMAQEALAQTLLGFERFDDARDMFTRIIEEHRDELSESEVVDICWQLGDLDLKAGRLPNARQGFERALEMDPNHVLSLRELSQIDSQMGHWEQAYQGLDRYSRLIPNELREAVFFEMANIARDHLKDSARELEPLVRGAGLSHPSVEMLERLAQVLAARGEHQRAAAVLQNAAQQCDDKERSAGLLHKLAALYERELDNEPLALKAYHVSLDLDPRRVSAFEDMERLLVKRKEWTLLEESYRAMIGRAKDEPVSFRLVLWRSLAELYEEVLHDVDNAIMAYEVIRELDQSRPEEAQKLSELYLRSPKHREQATRIAHEMLADDSALAAQARQLKELYHAQSNFDGVLVYCGILEGLGEARDEEFQMLSHLKKGVRPWPTRGLGEEGWQLAVLPELRSPVGELAAELYRLAPDAFAQSNKRLGLKKKDFISLDGELYLAGMLRRVHGALGLPPPGLCIRKGSMEPAHLAPSSPPTLVIGQNHAITRTVDSLVARFLMAYHLAFMRPQLFLTGLYPDEQLRELLLGLCVLYNRDLPGAEHNGVARWASHFENIPGDTLRALQEPARRAYQALLRPESTEGMAKAAHLSAARVGLVMSGEMAAAVRGVQETPVTAPGLTAEARIDALARFAGSREHLRLRKKMGSGLESRGS